MLTSTPKKFFFYIFQLGDQHLFGADDQHTLTRWLSFLDAGAIVAAPLSGYLLDSVGFAPTAFITITLGIMQQTCLLVAGTNSAIMIFSFGTYAIYRAFLFPYFFASLSRKMGFRFFGFLSGISFCLSGLTQFGVAPIAYIVEGDCHQYPADTIKGSDLSCEEGSWRAIHLIQIAVLLLLLFVPIFDTWSAKKSKGKAVLTQETASLSAHSADYGAIESQNP